MSSAACVTRLEGILASRRLPWGRNSVGPTLYRLQQRGDVKETARGFVLRE
jgi:hypothetical protein